MATVDATLRIGESTLLAELSLDPTGKNLATQTAEFNTAISDNWPSAAGYATAPVTIDDVTAEGISPGFVRRCLAMIQSIHERKLADGRVVRVITISEP